MSHDNDSFSDALVDWMNRAPFLSLAIALHLVALFVIQAFAGAQRPEPEEVILHASPQPPIEEPVPEPEPEVLEPLEVLELEPVELTEVELLDESQSDDTSDEPADSSPVSPFLNANRLSSEIGLAGGGAPPGTGSPGRGARRGGMPREASEALDGALRWLSEHQRADGSWDADGFDDECRADGLGCAGHGDPLHDVGVSALALMAFLGAGETTLEGTHRETVRRGVHWLKRSQDPDSGRFGADLSKEWLYGQAIATLALAEAYHADPNPRLGTAVRNAVRLCLRARNEYGGWRYDLPPIGEADASITGWMLFALAAAEDAGIEVGHAAMVGGASLIDELTDPATGRTGYIDRGGASSRLANLAYEFPGQLTESMTAVGLLCRALTASAVGETFDTQAPVVAAGAQLLMERLPIWDPAGGGPGDTWRPGDHGRTNDMYYWYYGSLACFQIGGRPWKRWRDAMHALAVDNQRTGPGCTAGSWDPSGPWGSVGGRVYSTAMMALCLEASLRYTRGFGMR